LPLEKSPFFIKTRATSFLPVFPDLYLLLLRSLTGSTARQFSKSTNILLNPQNDHFPEYRFFLKISITSRGTNRDFSLNPVQVFLSFRLKWSLLTN